MGDSTMSVDNTYDVLVVGGGPAGENAADLATRGGLRVAVIESELVGGECSYWACMPSKALLRPGEAVEAARRVPGAAEAITGDLDLSSVLARRDALTSSHDDSGQVDWLDSVGVDLIRGYGRLAGERLVEVETQSGEVRTYEAKRAVVVATGTAAAIPPIKGLSDVEYWTSREITTATEAPRRLLVVGGGVVGSEMAQAWKWLGSEEVTVVEMADRLLPAEEPEAGEHLAKAFERMDIRVHVGAAVKSVERVANGIRAFVEDKEGTAAELEADRIVIATGRRPNTESLGLDSVGVANGYIEVDDHLVAKGVPGEWLYAVGDVNGRSLLTHTGKYQARIAGARIAGLDTEAWGDRVAVPRVVFTSPEVAAVGITESAARDAGFDVRTVSYDIGSVAGTATLGRGYKGFAKLVIDAEREVILGATFVGPRVGELLHSATVAIVGEVPLQTLWHAIPSFPTVSEVWLRLLETYRDEQKAEFA